MGYQNGLNKYNLKTLDFIQKCDVSYHDHIYKYNLWLSVICIILYLLKNHKNAKHDLYIYEFLESEVKQTLNLV